MIFRQQATARNYGKDPHCLLELMERNWLECRKRQLEMLGAMEQRYKHVLLAWPLKDMRNM